MPCGKLLTSGSLGNEHRTSNIERPVPNAGKSPELEQQQGAMFDAPACPLSTFGVGRSMFDVRAIRREGPCCGPPIAARRRARS